MFLAEGWLVIACDLNPLDDHFYYYYCSDYDNYPYCCCYSILLDDFLSLDEHDLLHLEPSLIFGVPQKDYSHGNHPLCLQFASCLAPPDITHFCKGSCCHFGSSHHGFKSVAQKLEHNIHADTLFSFLDDLCSPAVYGLCTLSIFAPHWFIPTFITSISDCLLLQQDVVSNILTDVVGESYSDSNWITTALLHQWYPWCPAHSMLVIWM